MRQAIIVKYLGPTNTRPGRVVAKASAGRVVVEWDHSIGSDENYVAAARALAAKFGWTGTWVGGWAANGAVFVATDDNPTFTLKVE